MIGGIEGIRESVSSDSSSNPQPCEFQTPAHAHPGLTLDDKHPGRSEAASVTAHNIGMAQTGQDQDLMGHAIEISSVKFVVVAGVPDELAVHDRARDDLDRHRDAL